MAGHGRASCNSRWVRKHRSRPIRALKHVDKRYSNLVNSGEAVLRGVRTDVKVPSEKCTGVSGAWHGMAERAVTPGGSASTVAGPDASQNTVTRGIFTLENSENPCLGYIAEIILFFIWGQGS